MNKGGNGKPLSWLYDLYTVRSGSNTRPALICYFKQVVNGEQHDVRDVRWEVASFYRRYIAKQSSEESCPQFEGAVRDIPTNGPLNFGSSSNGYDTTVVQPKDGWSETASAADNLLPKDDIGSVVNFATFRKDGTLAEAQFVIRSGMYIDNGKTTIRFILNNKSDVSFSILLNLSADERVRKYAPMVQQAFRVEPKYSGTFDIESEKTASIQPAAIIVYDENNQIIAIDSGSFYTIKGNKERSDQSFWDFK